MICNMKVWNITVTKKDIIIFNDFKQAQFFYKKYKKICSNFTPKQVEQYIKGDSNRNRHSVWLAINYAGELDWYDNISYYDNKIYWKNLSYDL